MLKKLLNKDGSDNLVNQIMAKALGSFGLKVASIGLSFINSILLARCLGAEGYGTYAYALAWIFLLQLPATLGHRQILMRQLATYAQKSEWGLMQGLLRWANIAVLVVSVTLSLVTALIVGLMRIESTEIRVVSYLALILLPMLSLTTIRMGAMQGLHKVVKGQLPETLIEPIIFIILVSIAYLRLGSDLNVTVVMAIKISTVTIGFISGTLLLQATIPQAVKTTSPQYQIKPWLKSALPFMLISGMYIINNRSDIIMLGQIQGSEAVGIYAVANRGAQMISFILMAVNMSLAPTIAQLYAEGNLERLQKIITKSTRVIFFTSLPIALTMIIFGKWFLLVFGSEFTQGYLALALLSFGQLINASAGSVGLLLNMTGNERDTAKGVGISAMLNICLNALLIPLWGVKGAATATMTSTIIWNLLLYMAVKRRLGIQPIALGKISNQTKN